MAAVVHLLVFASVWVSLFQLANSVVGGLGIVADAVIVPLAVAMWVTAVAGDHARWGCLVHNRRVHR